MSGLYRQRALPPLKWRFFALFLTKYLQHPKCPFSVEAGLLSIAAAEQTACLFERKVLVSATQSILQMPLRACCRGSGYFSRRIRQVVSVAVLFALFCAGIFVAPADAAFVSLKEAEMDAIYGQASFGANPIDIRYLPTITHVDPTLLSINTSGKLSSLFSLYNSSSIHYAYFVDSISWCSGFNNGIVGCGDQPGDDYVVESSYAAAALGAELMGHELAHNLALGHHPAPNNDNLLDASVGSAPGPPQTTTLTVSQANTILSRPSVKTDVNGKYIQIQPVLIAASLVPEPTTLALAIGLFGLSTVGLRRRR